MYNNNTRALSTFSYKLRLYPYRIAQHSWHRVCRSIGVGLSYSGLLYPQTSFKFSGAQYVYVLINKKVCSRLVFHSSPHCRHELCLYMLTANPMTNTYTPSYNEHFQILRIIIWLTLRGKKATTKSICLYFKRGTKFSVVSLHL